MPACPKRSCNVKFCTQGVSLLPHIKDHSVAIKTAAFSQYPRCPGTCSKRSKALKPPLKHFQSPCLRTQCTMGYSVVTKVHGKEYRYTEWRAFNTESNPFAPDWTQAGLQATELYDHSSDYDENYNIASKQSTSAAVKHTLANLLKKCAVTGCSGKDMSPPSSAGSACPRDMSSDAYVRLNSRCAPRRSNSLGGNHPGLSIAQCAKLCERTQGCGGFDASVNCWQSGDQKCCYLKKKCQGSGGRNGMGHRMRTCGDMYAPPGQFLIADKNFPCGSDCAGCFAGDGGGDDGWLPFNNNGGVVVVHG